MDATIRHESDGRGNETLVVEGALDLTSKDGLLDAADKACDAPDAVRLILDLRGVSFMDSTGIGALVRCGSAASDAGLDMVLRRPSDRVRRILDVTGLLDAWPIEE